MASFENCVDPPNTKFFDDLNLNFEIPIYLKHLLIFTGFDNVKSISEFSETDFSELQRFAKEELAVILGPNERKMYFGIYSNNVNLFKIPEGHKKLIVALIKHCKGKIKTKDNQNGNRNYNSFEKEKEFETSKKRRIMEKDLCEVVPKTKARDHIGNVTYKYIIAFCENNLPEDVAKTVLDKLNASESEINIVDDKMATVRCFLCKADTKVYLSPTGKKWILSNFNIHFKNHFAENKSKQPFKKPQKAPLLNYYSIDHFFSKDSSSVSGCSTTKQSNINTETREVMDVIDLEELDFDKGGNQTETSVSATCSFTSSDTSSLNNNSKELKEKNSRRERQLRKIYRSSEDKNQLKITDFFELVHSVKDIINRNLDIKEDFLLLTHANPTHITGLLDKLQETAIQNSNVKKHGHRFSEPLKLFSLYIYIIGGRMTYENLYSNLPKALPSISTINRCLDDSNRIAEGEVRFEGLKEYLLKRNCPLKVFFSEDQTAILKRPQYDCRTNKIVGFVPPLSSITGFPVNDKFGVSSLEDIQNMFQNEKISINAYTFMAQPLLDQTPAYCLTIFGSDNRFSHEDVLKRWTFLEAEAKKYGIEIFGFAADGDTRCLKSMQIRSGLFSDNVSPNPSANPYKNYFVINFDPQCTLYVQDCVHIATKLKTRFLKANITLPMGKYFVSSKHIEILMTQYSKDQHLLCTSDLDVTDKMNFNAIEKLSDKRITTLLENISEARATKQYLVLTRYLIESFLEKDLDVITRIYMTWYTVFFIRIWKQWLKENKYSTVKNGITSNTYSCIEINAHNLLLAVEKCRNSPNLYLPWLYSSQPCEKIFRQTRSMTTTFSTAVNFSLLDILRRLNRIQCLNEISTDLSSEYRFPREENRKLGGENTQRKMLEISMPSQMQIKDVLDKAKNDVIGACTQLGMMCADFEKCCITVEMGKASATKKTQYSETDLPLNITHEVPNYSIDQVPDCNSNGVANRVEDVCELELSDTEYNEQMAKDISLLKNVDTLNLTDYSNKNVNKDSSFLNVMVNNKKMLIRKSALCWYFYNKKGRLSSDRLQRVRGMTSTQREKNSVNTKSNKQTKKKPKRRLNRCLKKSDTETEPSEDYSNESEFEYEDLDEIMSEEETNHLNTIKIETEKYYCVFYDEQWYLGKVIELGEDSCKIKFLRENLNRFIWPAKEDIQEVEKQYVYHGPLKLNGVNSFTIARADRLAINKKFKDFKQNI